jgi:Uncharacterized protein conserved in bacteria (DUF2252)
MNIQQATQEYEAWLASHVRVLKADLAAKHKLMAHDPFSFLRATFYRWMQMFPQLCPELANAPTVLSVGDLHVENYGTWRDAEGRLVWGINDFDEAFPLPYTVDLVRLATSACLAIQLNHLSLDPALACAAILEGYTAGLDKGGKPFVLAERYRWLREAVTGRLRDPTRFWEKLVAVPLVKRVPADAMSLLKRAMPKADLAFRVSHRQAGLGSLGRDRFTAIAEWCGGKIAREVKVLLPSACVWAGAKPKAEAIYYQEILRCSVRVADPFLGVRNGWVLRRLAPYCSRIELFQLPRGHDEQKLLRAMGREVANVHVGTRRAVNPVRRDLHRRKTKWLRKATKIMVEATHKDWKEWQKWMC